MWRCSAGKTEEQGTAAGDPPAEGTENASPENRKTVTGLRVISSGGAAAWFRSDAGTEEDWLLFFGAQSPHAGERDRAALEVAEDLIRLLNPD